ncbi:hypothetical protein DL96DRAFT_1153648 [Flagelloscypha sp. PMI_526]|nr:hypothetical protein DL96DRAFT_1153648 [Flagelloscypha sp. PMI_526]
MSASISTQPPAPRRLVTPSSPQSDSKSACPICRKRPMHLRYECLTVKKGPAAIRKRIAALQKKSENAALVDELSLLARNLEMASSSAPGPMDVDSDLNELADMSLQGLTAPSTNGKSRSEQSDFPAEREEDPGSRRRRRSFSKEIVEPEPELEEHPPAFRRGIMRLTNGQGVVGR